MLSDSTFSTAFSILDDVTLAYLRNCSLFQLSATGGIFGTQNVFFLHDPPARINIF